MLLVVSKSMVRRKRNGRVEALRLLAIMLILLNHTLQEDIFPAEAFPVSVASSLLARLGGLGDVLFFGITAYYLCQGKGTFRDSLRRSYLLWRELIWYSAGLFLATVIVRWAGVGFQAYVTRDFIDLGIKSCMPLASQMWWYPSAYVVFLLAMPWINRILSFLGRDVHGAVTAALFVLYSVPVSAPIAQLGWTPLLFVYQYIVFSWVTWYAKPSRGLLRALVLASSIVGLVGPFVGGLLGVDVAGGYLNLPQSLPSMVLGYSLVLLAADDETDCGLIVGRLASSAFAA